MKMGDCDCCGERRELRRVIYLGMDTDVCAECCEGNEADHNTARKLRKYEEYEHEDWLEDL